MAKTTGPLLSQTAHGSVGKILTFSKRKSGQQARSYNKPLKTPSPKQRAQRRLTEFLVAQWQSMSDGDKATWNWDAKSSGLDIAGYHYFLREAQRDLYTHTGLCAYWHCNEIVGGKVLDLSGNGNHGTLQPNYPSNAPTLVASKSTRFSNALKFAGISHAVTVPDSPSLHFTDGLTIEVWAKRTAWGGTDEMPALVTALVGNTGFFLISDYYNSHKFRFRLGNGIVTRQIYSDTVYSLNDWNCITCTYGPDTTMRMRVNNILQSETDTISIIVPTATALKIGHLYNSHIGPIDEVCLYNRALSAAEIKARYDFATAKI